MILHRTPRHRLRAEGELGDLEGTDLPGLATVAGGHGAGDTLTQAQGLVVAGISSVEDDLGVGPLVGGHGAAVLLGALDRGAPALGLAAAGRQGRDDLAVDADGLGVVAAGIVELVCKVNMINTVNLYTCRSTFGVLTVHGDLVTGAGLSGGVVLDDGLAVALTERHEGVGVDGPLVGVVVVRDGLDQVAVGSAHTDPEGSVSLVVGGDLGQDERGGRLPDEGRVGDGSGRQGRAHGSVDRRSGSRDGGDGLEGGRHLDGCYVESGSSGTAGSE